MFREDKTAVLIQITIANENNEMNTDAFQGIWLKKNKIPNIWFGQLNLAVHAIFVFNWTNASSTEKTESFHSRIYNNRCFTTVVANLVVMLQV